MELDIYFEGQLLPDGNVHQDMVLRNRSLCGPKLYLELSSLSFVLLVWTKSL